MKKIDLTSAAVTFTEWFSGIAILNLSWLLFSLPIFTVIPATDAVFEVVHEWKENGKPQSVFTQFTTFFKANFKKSFKLGLPIFIGGLILIVDLSFLISLTQSTTGLQIFKYAFYTFAILILLIILYIYPLSKIRKEVSFQLFLLAFMLIIGKPKITLAVFSTLVACLFAFNWFPAMLFFLPVSGFAWLGETALENIQK
ncbi:MAG TPA: DUF624 domain-containing protein [Candidatus Atopostipes pullistercoris]|uniref:DUF624 domain-containing protein n=1 Tax=Candidatus Atopostipes pullistercoris TaxID=2838467 RepID=A0A9D2G262_9LACT|nr:DUF624 domain-containing protein [Candidatus Atopostipes pullistercoris]